MASIGPAPQSSKIGARPSRRPTTTNSAKAKDQGDEEGGKPRPEEARWKHGGDQDDREDRQDDEQEHVPAPGAKNRHARFTTPGANGRGGWPSTYWRASR